MSKKQLWGLIFFIILIIAAILVTKEPWKRSSAEMRGALETGAPSNHCHQMAEAGIRFSNGSYRRYHPLLYRI